MESKIVVAPGPPHPPAEKTYQLRWSVTDDFPDGYYMVKVVILGPSLAQPSGGLTVVFEAESLDWIRVDRSSPKPITTLTDVPKPA